MKVAYLVGALALAISASQGLAVAAAAPAAPPAAGGGPAATSANALPDWSGIWENKTGIIFALPRDLPPNPPPLTPKYAAIYADLQKAQAEGRPVGDPTANCAFPGMPRVMVAPYPMEFLISPERVTILHEYMSQVRRIFTDGRPHPDDLEPSYNGHSIGHWEGDTLVVDTVGLIDSTRIDQAALPHTDKLHLIERFRLISPDRLQVQTTMIDPEVFTKPWTTVWTYERHRDWDILDYDCSENNRNPIDASGVTGMILAP